MVKDLPVIKFAIPAFEMCAFDGQFGEHSLSGCIGPFAVPLLGHECVVMCHTP
jgi:hypothetical protein